MKHSNRQALKLACPQAKDLLEWKESPEEFVGREVEAPDSRESLRPCAELLLASLLEVGAHSLSTLHGTSPGQRLLPALPTGHMAG